MSDLHDEEGPVKWIAMQLVQFGLRSPRVLMLTTVRLVDALSSAPSLIEHYLPHFTSIIQHDPKHKGCPDTESKVKQSPSSTMYKTFVTTRVCSSTMP